MRKHFPTLLASFISATLYGSYAYADLTQQCLVGVPMFEGELISGNYNELPISIESKDSSVTYPNVAKFTGNVVVKQGNRQLQAQEVELHQEERDKSEPKRLHPSRTLTAEGDIHYDDNLVTLLGTKAWTNLDNKDADIYEGNYQFVGRQGRGSANKIALRDNRYLIMRNGTFTTCLPNDNSWSIVGSEIIQDNDEQLAEIWHARFNIGSVPIFYSPYLQIPTGDKRRSGLLLPTLKYSNHNGLGFNLPYYWNIAPNFDATISPNLMSHRGLQWQTEFRYLLTPGQGLLAFDWLPDDKRYKKDDRNDDNYDRWLFHWQHQGVMDQVWRFNVDYTKTSDDQYINDIDTNYGSVTDGYVSQKYGIGYADKHWDTSLNVKQFQVFSNSGDKNAYRASPQFDITNYQYDLGPFNLKTYGQFVYFTSENSNNPKASRWHLEPTLSLPVYDRWGTFETEVKLLATHYQQSISDHFIATNPVGAKLEESVNRVLPNYKINGKLVFDRDMQWLKEYTQTLEPRFQYLYIPYKNQSNIYIYDTTLLQSDYAGLFRDRLYGGLDRVASANQVTTGITTRVYDETLEERFNASIGQIYYFEPARTGDKRFNRKEDNRGSLVWAADSFWKINSDLLFRNGLQYDNHLNNITLGDAILEYRPEPDRLLQLTYRYASESYISSMTNYANSHNSPYQQSISQVGVVASQPVTNNWSVVGAYYVDPKEGQTNDVLVGLKYANCCWGLNVAFERKIVDWNRKGDQQSDYDNKIFFNLELRGLSNRQSMSTAKMLSSNILPYQSAF